MYRREGDERDKLLDHTMDVIASITECQDELRRETRHVLTRVAKCIDIEGGIFENALHQVNCTNFVT